MSRNFFYPPPPSGGNPPEKKPQTCTENFFCPCPVSLLPLAGEPTLGTRQLSPLPFPPYEPLHRL